MEDYIYIGFKSGPFLFLVYQVRIDGGCISGYHY